MRFVVIPSRRWRNIITNATASIFGACPYVNDADSRLWVMEDMGFTIRDTRTNTVGLGRPPWSTREDADAFASALNARFNA